MQQVYSQCTCCYRSLTDDEVEKNGERENFYYTICDDCIKKSTDRIFKIIGVASERESE